jgi:hypothetical protein
MMRYKFNAFMIYGVTSIATTIVANNMGVIILTAQGMRDLAFSTVSILKIDNNISNHFKSFCEGL